jgi:transglutaminase-like putative cysteine protease
VVVKRLVQTLASLPRDARDTLFLLAVIGWTLLPHLQHLPAWCTALAAAVLAWRARLAWTSGALPGRWTLVTVLALAVGLTLVTEHTLFGKEAGVTLLVVLMALKTLELRARRDALVVFFLGFFLVLTNFLYSQSLLVAASMMLSVWGLLTALVLAHMPVGRPPLMQAAALAGRTALLGAPVMVALFVLFPRVGPLWGLPQDAMATTGLSGTMRLGAVAELATDDSVAMRLRFLDRTPSPGEMYFRGPVLSEFDGRQWTRGGANFPAEMRLRADTELRGSPLSYEVTLEPSRLSLLPLLELTPAEAEPRIEGLRALVRQDLQWQADRPLTERVRFEATAWPAARHGPREAVLALRDLVDLPPGYNPRTLQWAAELRARADMAEADPRTLVAAVLAHVRTAGFSYTLSPGTYGEHAIDEFWLDRRTGFCEHFASAFVVVMRALDVPARIVTGYQGSDPQPVDGYWIVRQSHAHAWAEYWQPGAGWVRVDPTAAVAPERIDRSRNLAPPPGLVAGAFISVSPELAAQLRLLWERIDNGWNQWVLNYSRGTQLDLLRQLGVASPDWKDLAWALLWLLSGSALAGAAWALWDRQRQDPWHRLQQKVARRLARLGVDVQAHEPPRRRAEAVRRRLGDAGEALAATLDELDRLRYGAGSAAGIPRGWWRRFGAAADAARGAP